MKALVEEAFEDDEILDIFGRDLLSLSRRSMDRWLDRACNYWRQRGFPYPEVSPDEIEREYRNLERVQPNQVLRRGQLHASMVGLRLANSFHPQMWEVPARSHTRSPLEHFEDDQTLRKLLSRAPHFWPGRRCWNEQCLRSVLRTYSGGRVANFRPTVARAVISQMSEPGETVLDFSAGFGGRLLGALTLPRHYVGIDPAKRQVAGLVRMNRALADLAAGTAEIHLGPAEILLPRLDARSADLIFSSPPYFDVEKYSRERNQSYVRYPTYEEWRESFLQNVVHACHRVLREGGRLVVNVADLRRYPIASDVREFAEPLFGSPQVLKLLMNNSPQRRSNGDPTYRRELVFVFRRHG